MPPGISGDDLATRPPWLPRIAAVVALVLQSPLYFESLPAALRVRLPGGVSLPPGARTVALTEDSLGGLLRVAAAR